MKELTTVPHVAGAVAAATRPGGWMMNGHASGGSVMMGAALDAPGASEAQAAGADFLVVGRPILADPDRRAAAERIAAGCRASIL